MIHILRRQQRQLTRTLFTHGNKPIKSCCVAQCFHTNRCWYNNAQAVINNGQNEFEDFENLFANNKNGDESTFLVSLFRFDKSTFVSYVKRYLDMLAETKPHVSISKILVLAMVDDRVVDTSDNWNKMDELYQMIRNRDGKSLNASQYHLLIIRAIRANRLNIADKLVVDSVLANVQFDEEHLVERLNMFLQMNYFDRMMEVFRALVKNETKIRSDILQTMLYKLRLVFREKNYKAHLKEVLAYLTLKQDEIVEEGDERLLRSILFSLGTIQSIDEANVWFEAILKVKPDVSRGILTAYIRILVSAGEISEAIDVIKNSNMTFTARAYDQILQRATTEEQIQEVLAMMHVAQVQKSLATYTELIRFLGNNNRKDDVLNLYADLKRNPQFQPDNVILSMVLNYCGRNEEIANMIYEDSIQLRVPHSATLLHNLVKYSTNYREHLSNLVMDESQRDQVEKIHRHFPELLPVLLYITALNEGVDSYSVMNKQLVKYGITVTPRKPNQRVAEFKTLTRGAQLE